MWDEWTFFFRQLVDAEAAEQMAMLILDHIPASIGANGAFEISTRRSIQEEILPVRCGHEGMPMCDFLRRQRESRFFVPTHRACVDRAATACCDTTACYDIIAHFGRSNTNCARSQ